MGLLVCEVFNRYCGLLIAVLIGLGDRGWFGLGLVILWVCGAVEVWVGACGLLLVTLDWDCGCMCVFYFGFTVCYLELLCCDIGCAFVIGGYICVARCVCNLLWEAVELWCFLIFYFVG